MEIKARAPDIHKEMCFIYMYIGRGEAYNDYGKLLMAACSAGGEAREGGYSRGLIGHSVALLKPIRTLRYQPLIPRRRPLLPFCACPRVSPVENSAHSRIVSLYIIFALVVRACGLRTFDLYI